MYDYTDIRANIKSNPICFVFKINKNKEFDLIIKSDGKSEAKKILKKKESYKENIFYLIIKLTFHKGTGWLQGGSLKAGVSAYKFNDDKLTNLGNSKPYSKMVGPVWFSKDFLEKNNWNNKYLDIIVKKLVNGKVQLSLISEKNYEVYFK
jgi:hypothetical protein